jgi:predicted nucleic acid-binding protein
MPLNLLVDTCVWLDLVKDYRHQPVINALEDLTSAGEIELLVPQVVLDEFARRKDAVAADAARSLKSHFNLVRNAVTRFGVEAAKDATLKALDDVDHAAILRGEAVNASISRIEKLLTSVPALPTTDAVKARVTDRAIAKRAPYHLPKNSVGDAILVELYADALAARRPPDTRFAFVTHNVRDFSEPSGDQRKSHPDLLPLFDGPGSVYSIDLIAVINGIDEDLLADHDLQFNGYFEPRRLSEIMEAEHLLFRQVWYNRHWNLRSGVESGEIKIITNKEFRKLQGYHPEVVADEIWEGALAAAKRTEEEVGIENLGPWDDFEWGMINGKLSALRWIMGDEWDMLDT